MYCWCRGVDDGRPMVQCDECGKWYHEECAEEEGRPLSEEAAWYCKRSCEKKKRRD